jgi:hypothetical protein
MHDEDLMDFIAFEELRDLRALLVVLSKLGIYAASEAMFQYME